MISKDVETLDVSSDRDLSNNTETNSSKVNSDNNAVRVIDKGKCQVTWKDIGLSIDRLLLLTCACITAISTIVIVVCFLVLN